MTDNKYQVDKKYQPLKVLGNANSKNIEQDQYNLSIENDCLSMEENHKIFAKEMSVVMKTNKEKSNEEATKRHFEKVYELILKNQICTK
jgi:hypothetical protein